MRRAFPACLLGLALSNCTDTTTGTHGAIRILEPLTVSWSGSDSGQSYHWGQQAVFRATTSLRVVWDFRIEGVLSGGVDTQQFINQDHIEFSWRSSTASGFSTSPDSCVATVRFMQLDPRDAGKTRVGFAIRP